MMRSFRGLFAIGLLGAGACAQVMWKTDVEAVSRPVSDAAPTVVKSPVKVHMRDGSTVIFKDGSTISHDRISGNGVGYPPLSDFGTTRQAVPMDSVVAVEAFNGKVLGLQSFLLTAAATAGTVVLMSGLAVALFGSCPTVYADTGAGLELQAEGFSYSIASIMERRDVDPLRARAGADGSVRLELRNEALETHFINHVELLAVRHAAGERVVPDQRGVPVTLGEFARVVRATDRAGRDAGAAIRAADGQLYATHASVTSGAKAGDLDDWIDLDVADLPPGDSVAVLLRLRNSLLNTVLLYEGMLGGRDAIDWLETGLQGISATVEMARWYTSTMGMHVSADGGPEAHMGDVGPIAFRDVAIVVPRTAVEGLSGGARIRLRFVADNWRIDEVRVAGRMSRPEYALLPVDSVIVPMPAHGGASEVDAGAVGALADADDRYLETRPGQRLSLVFRADRGAKDGDETTYLLAWQGWYREWIRGAWLAAPTRTAAFVPGDEAVLEALGRWQAKKESFEREFHASKIPVR